MAKRYRIRPDRIECIVNGYGTVENFVKLCMKGEEGNIDPNGPLEDLKFNPLIDTTSGTKNQQVRYLYQWLFGKYGFVNFIDGEKLMETLDSLGERPSEIMRYILAFSDGKYHSFEDAGEKFGLTRERINQIVRKNIRQLREPSNLKNYFIARSPYETEGYIYSPEEDERRKELLDKIEKSNLIFVPDKEYAQEPDDISPEELTEIATELREIQHAGLQRKYQVEGTSLDELNLSVRTYNLLRRAGIHTVEQLKIVDKEELMSRPGVIHIGKLVHGNKFFQEIEDKLAEFEQKHVEGNEVPEDIITPDIEENTQEELSIEQLQEQLEMLRKKNKEKEDILLRQQLLREIAKEQQIGLELDAQIREAKDKTK